MLSPMRNKMILPISNCAAINKIAEPMRLANRSPMPAPGEDGSPGRLRTDVPGNGKAPVEQIGQEARDPQPLRREVNASVTPNVRARLSRRQLLAGNFLLLVFAIWHILPRVVWHRGRKIG